MEDFLLRLTPSLTLLKQVNVSYLSFEILYETLPQVTNKIEILTWLFKIILAKIVRDFNNIVML
jgi:hypothetical protein